MKDAWYGDKRDLVKWSVLLHIARECLAQRILQIAYFRPSEFAQVIIDGRQVDLPSEVTAHFRNIRSIEGIRSETRVTVFHAPFADRIQYLSEVLRFVSSFDRERCLVFLDPDTGLQPHSYAGLEHVLECEARRIWDSLKRGDVFAFYQHKPRGGRSWIEPKKRQLEQALHVPDDLLKIAHGLTIAPDVAFYYGQKT